MVVKSPRGIAIAAIVGFLFLLVVATDPTSVKANDDDDNSQVNYVVVNGTVVSDGDTSTVRVNRCDHCVQSNNNVIFIDLDWLLRHLHSHH
jgi:hypothetical protein